MEERTVQGEGLLCPSADPAMAGSMLLGVVGGTVDEPRLQYLVEPQPITDELLALAGELKPTEVFRFSALCAESRCTQFDGVKCGLVGKIIDRDPAVLDVLPICRIRPRCRWWQQEGRAACHRCPQVVTLNYAPSVGTRAVGDPAV
jgi:hypothetical protein